MQPIMSQNSTYQLNRQGIIMSALTLFNHRADAYK